MKSRIKTILFLLVTVYIIPGAFLLLVDRDMLWYYLWISSSTVIPYYIFATRKKRTCKIFGRELRF